MFFADAGLTSKAAAQSKSWSIVPILYVPLVISGLTFDVSVW